MFRSIVVALLLAGSVASSSAWAHKPSVYPAKGQSADRKSSDDAQCLAWAKQDTGIDPAAVAAAPTPTTGPQGERLRGAARGAVAGGVIGGITGDAGKGAGVGATVGVLAGGRRSRQNQAAQAQSAQASKGQAIDTYYRAYGACMQGRGYTVK
jgi:uncharacterized protein YcfJ